MSAHHVERTLWRRDGIRDSRIAARASRAGGVVVHLHERGAQDYAGWGVDDREATIELTPIDAAELIVALIEERCGGRPDALDRFGDFRIERGIAGRHSEWT